MKYNLVALDLDDTLLNTEHKLENETITVINELKKMGLNVIISTGRMYQSALPYAVKLGLNGPMITYNGAYVRNIFNDKLIYHQTIEKNVARELIQDVERSDMHINIYLDDNLYIEKHNDLSKIYEKISGVKAKEVGKLSFFIKSSPTKLLLIEKDYEKKMKFKEESRQKFYDRLAITESKKKFIEFMAPGVSKGKALKLLAEKHNIKQGEVVAIGDGWNDMEMIEWAGLGIAVQNAPEGVKKRADMIAPPHHDNGVATVLRDLFL